jgi:hypothetical protein
MVGPPSRKATRSSGRSLCGTAWIALWLSLAGGCGVVPKTTLEESRRANQTLRADNARLKDVALDLRSRNQDLSDRAVDDARRIAVQDEAIERLERSLTAYQTDRENLERSFAELKQQVQIAAEASVSSVASVSDPPSSSSSITMPSPAIRVEGFVKAHPGWWYDPKSKTLAIRPGGLFETSSARFKPGAIEAIEELARTLSAVDGRVRFEIHPYAVSSPVQPAGIGAGGDMEARARFLSASRAARLRDRLLATATLQPSQVCLKPPVAIEDSERELDRCLSIQVIVSEPSVPPSGPGLDSGTQPPR